MYSVTSLHKLIQSSDVVVIAHLTEETEEAAGEVSIPQNRPLDVLGCTTLPVTQLGGRRNGDRIIWVGIQSLPYLPT